MENIKSSISLNLSSQANCYGSKQSSLSQFNYFVILGLGCMDLNTTDAEYIPISIYINKAGELSINGVDGEVTDDQNIHIYSDKKVTTSND